ncbi:hypothetical protein ACFCYM_15970 [Streptomyces sp. NPDC056254]|uniref:hypothetical protein n=1 Tax=Streptomyces sp. NPDC056254 TaxID=3345763 RepID=UPI0035D5498B
MKLRHVASSAVGAFALVLSLSNPSVAANGDFTYLAWDHSTDEAVERVLHNPESKKCINLPYLGHDSGSGLPAWRVQNKTDEVVATYLDSDCDGSAANLQDNGPLQPDNFEVRSVMFYLTEPSE